jgi:Caspase domain
VTTLADPAASRAVLIGAYRYQALDALSGVANNLLVLREALVDPALWGLPAEHCAMMTQPSSPHEALDVLQAAGEAATDTLLVYFSGHGLIDHANDDELYLALPSSDPRRVDRTALPWSWVRREMQDSAARRKIAILDCCYSGRALGVWMGDDAEIADLLEVEGTCILTATARTRRALAPPDAHFTAFTGELITALTEGIPGGPALLDMDTIYRRVKMRMRAKDLPIPQQSQFDRGGDIALVRNRAARGEQPAQTSVVMEPTSSSPRSARPTRPADESWRALLVPARPRIERRDAPVKADSSGAYLATAFLGLIWLLLESTVAWRAGFTPLNVSGLAVGLAMITATLTMKRDAYLDLLLLIVFAGCALGEAIVTTSWLARGVSIAAPPVLFLVFGSAVPIQENIGAFKKDSAAWDAAETAVGRAKMQRWLTPAVSDADTLMLVDQLMPIPAARFADLGGAFGCDLLAVAGRRVLFIATTTWSPGRYTLEGNGLHEVRRDGRLDPVITKVLDGFATALEGWRSLLPDPQGGAQAVTCVLLVVDTKEHDAATGDVSLGFTQDEDVFVTTREQFSEVAGAFLIEEQNVLNATVLGEIAKLF